MSRFSEFSDDELNIIIDGFRLYCIFYATKIDNQKIVGLCAEAKEENRTRDRADNE